MQSGAIFSRDQGGVHGARTSWKTMAGRSAVLIAAASVALVSQSAKAASAAWTAAGSGPWATGTNWSGSNAPGSLATTNDSDTATFSNGLTNPVITVDTGRNIDNISFDTSALNYNLSGGSLLLSANGTLSILSTASATARVDAVYSPIALEGDYTIANNGTNSGSSVLNVNSSITSAATSGVTTLNISGTNAQGATASGTLGGIISNGGGTNVVAVNMSATGLWVLGGVSTYTGLTNVSSGTLQLGPTGSSTAVFNFGPVNIASGAVVEENPASGSTGSPAVTIGSLSGAGTLEYENEASAICNFNISESTSTTFSGVIQPTNTLNGEFVTFGKNGPGTLTLNGSTGSLQLQRGININAGGLTLAGNATLALPKAASGRDLFAVGQNANLTLDDTGTNVISRLLALDDSVTLNGGSLSLLGNSSAQSNEVIQAHNGASNVQEGLILGPGADLVNATAGTGQFALLVINGTTAAGYAGYGRLAGSSPLFQGTQLGLSATGTNIANIRFTNGAPTITGSGTASVSVLPGIITNSVSLSGSNTYGIATYTPTSVVALTPGVNNTGSLTAGTNVDATSALTNSSMTINSLQLDTGGSIDNTPGTLNISSGTILSTGASVSIGLGGGSTLKDTATTGTTTATGGTLATELVIYNTPASNLTIGATIVSPLGLTKGGAGTTILTADNSASLINGSNGVPTTINGGVLSISSANNLGAPANTINLNNFGELSSTGAAVTLGSGTITVGGTNAAYLSGGVMDVSGASTNVLTQGTGLIVGSGALIKTGVGILSLTSANTYTGGTNISGGELSLAAAQGTTSGPLGGGTASLPTGQITFSGGTLQYTSLNKVDYSKAFSTVAGQMYSIDTNGQNVTFATALNSVGGSLTKIGAGSLTLTGSGTYTGATTITGGTLVAGAVNALSVNSAFNVSAGTLDVSGFNNSIASLVVGASGAVNLGYATTLTSIGNVNLIAGSTLNLPTTFTGTLPDVLMNYGSVTGMFTNVNNLPGGDQLFYGSNSLTLNTSVTGGPANLVFNKGAGPGDGMTWDTVQPNFNTSAGSVAYSDTSNAANGTGDNVTFDDTNTGSYNVSIPSTVHPTSLTINNSVQNYTFNGSGGIAGPTGLVKTGSASLILATNNSYTGGTNVSAGTLVLASSNAFPSGTNQSGSSLIVGSGATLQIANHGSGTTYVPVISSLTNTGTIDLTNNALIVRNGSIGTINSMAAAAYNNGNWNASSPGGMITSTLAASDSTHLTAVGVATGLTGTFAGLNISSGDVVAKYTYYGDANLDGSVSSADYTLIDAGYLSSGTLTGWQNGDFNYDHVINGSDYTLIDNAFNMQGATLSTEIASATAQIAGGASAVPEPASLGLLGIGVIGLLGRRNRTRR